MKDLVGNPFGKLLRQASGAAAMTWALVFMLGVLAALSCLTIAGRLLAG